MTPSVWIKNGIIEYGGGFIIEPDDPDRIFVAICGDHLKPIKFRTDINALKHAEKHPTHLIQQISVTS